MDVSSFFSEYLFYHINDSLWRADQNARKYNANFCEKVSMNVFYFAMQYDIKLLGKFNCEVYSHFAETSWRLHLSNISKYSNISIAGPQSSCGSVEEKFATDFFRRIRYHRNSSSVPPIKLWCMNRILSINRISRIKRAIGKQSSTRVCNFDIPCSVHFRVRTNFCSKWFLDKSIVAEYLYKRHKKKRNRPNPSTRKARCLGVGDHLNGFFAKWWLVLILTN